MNNEKIFTFWEGKMPEYIKLCLETWKFPFKILTYDNLTDYTDKLPDKVKQLSFPKIADYVRVHVLRDNGGYWLDADTIMLSDYLPKYNMLGYPKLRNATIGYLYTEANSDMFKKWAKYQDDVIMRLPERNKDMTTWDVMGNAFTDDYIKKHPEISIGDITNRWAETYMIGEDMPRYDKYRMFYFQINYRLEDIDDTNMLMLHNSWTPDWYKHLSREEVLNTECTLSNFLKESI